MLTATHNLYQSVNAHLNSMLPLAEKIADGSVRDLSREYPFGELL